MRSGSNKIIVEYEDDELVVISKPAGLPVYSTRKQTQEDSVLEWFIRHYPGAKTVGEKDRPGVIHRLDKQTSGLLILAKTVKGYNYLGKLFRNRKITKEYLALVYGKTKRHRVIDKALNKIGQRGYSKVRVSDDGKQAVTEYWSKEHYQHALDPYSLIRIRLHTGRTHQIRVHLASENHPVVGDSLYGKPWSQKLSSILPRQFLHASRLELKLMDGTWLEVESKLPKDLENVLSQLQHN